jgi:ABC-type sugar transport system ATPase subunit
MDGQLPPSQREVERLFAVVAELRTHGVAMMFVDPRMDEIYRVADRIAVLQMAAYRHGVGLEPRTNAQSSSGGPPA